MHIAGDEAGVTAEQFDGVLADMGGGRFVSVWTDFDGSVASPGINLVGQIFDTEGTFLSEWTDLYHPDTIYFDPHADVIFSVAGTPSIMRITSVIVVMT